jgi:hypothetical protein
VPRRPTPQMDGNSKENTRTALRTLAIMGVVLSSAANDSAAGPKKESSAVRKLSWSSFSASIVDEATGY